MNGILTGGLHFTVDGFRLCYAVVTAFLWLVTSLFSLEYFSPAHEAAKLSEEEEKREKRRLHWYAFFVGITFFATEGVMLSADFMTALVFFEILSFTSFTWVIHEQTKEAVGAAYTYLFVAVIGGLILLMGLSLLQHAAGTLMFSELPEAIGRADRGEVLAAGICILFGFGAKAGMFPLHIWLPKAHPVAPAPASALLSGILTKVGVYGILMVCTSVMAGVREFGNLLLVLGLITMAVGAVQGLLALNLKKTLACSSMSQIGFILTGLAMSVLMGKRGELTHAAAFALWGSILHMVNHSLLKLTLFTGAGVVAMNLHELDLYRIRGFGRKKPLLMLAFGLASVGISGIPLFNGYLSKTLLHEAITEGAAIVSGEAFFLHCAEWVFMICGGCTFAYMLKLFAALFLKKNEDHERQKKFDAMGQGMTRLSAVCILVPAFLHAVLGVPAFAMRLGGFLLNRTDLHFSPFSAESLLGGAISLAIGAAVYFLVVPRLRAITVRIDRIKARLAGIWLRIRPTPAGTENSNATVCDRIAAAIHMIPEAVKSAKRLCQPAIRHIPAIFDLDGYLFQPFITRALPGFIGTFFKILSMLTDAIALGLRRTVLKERRVRDSSERTNSDLAVLLREVGKAESSMAQSFSFALIMTCIGILLILGVLILSALL